MESRLSILVLALCAIVAVNADSFKADVEQCKTQNNYAPDKNRPDSKQAKCFQACIMQKKGLANADGSLIADKLVDTYAKKLQDRPQKLQQMKTIVNDCKRDAERLTDKCDRVYSFKECSVKKAQQTQVFSRQPVPDPTKA